MKEEILNIIVDWWAKKIINTKHDNGAYDFTNFMANKLADMGVEQLATEQIEGFKRDLKEEIIKMYEEFPNSNLYLGCDYSPCLELRNAGEKNNIPELNFPFKVSMWFSNNHVNVRGGYGAKTETIYATEEYYLDRIKSTEESIKKYENKYYAWCTDEENLEAIIALKEDVENYKKAIVKLNN